MKTGRNAPCPCGSGKKYKKCCLRNDEQKEIQESQHGHNDEMQVNEEPETDVQPTKSLRDINIDKTEPMSQHRDSQDNNESNNDVLDENEQDKQFWKTFEQSDFNQKVSTVEKILDDPNELEKHYCYDLISDLFSSAQTSEDHLIVQNMIKRINREYPEIYKNERGYFIEFLIQLALTQHDNAKAIELILELAEDAGKFIDIFINDIDHLSYYCDSGDILKVLHSGWESITNKDGIMEFAIRNYANQAAELEIFEYIKESTHPDPENKELLQKLEIFLEPDLERLKKFIGHISGSANQIWTKEAFNYNCKMLKPTKKKKGKPQKKPKRIPLDVFYQNVYDLSCNFLEYLVQTEGYFYPKARIAQLEIKDFIMSRAKGDLEEQSSSLELAISPKTKKKKRTPLFDHILCPDRLRTESFIGNSLSIWKYKLYAAIIFFESIPAWLKFIESKGLIDEQLRQDTFSSVNEMLDSFKKIVKNHCKDYVYIIQQIDKAYWNKNG